MTFDKAMKEARKGHKVREIEMGDGWTVFYIASGKAKGYYALNPHTGSNYHYTPIEAHKASIHWSVAT